VEPGTKDLSSPGHLKDERGFVEIAMDTQQRGVNKSRVICLKYSTCAMHMTEDVQLWAYAHYCIE
jgi:hypothetical protein